MNVFVLCTGRCGSTTFIKASRHIVNYSAGHQSRSHLVGAPHLQYPADHIEADNRLSWFLGRLDKVYGADAFYVHLKRDPYATAKSFLKRWNYGIMEAYRSTMLLGFPRHAASTSPIEVCLDYCHTVNANIACFLKDKPHTMAFHLESAKTDFEDFWTRIGAEGHLVKALAEWDIRYNASSEGRA